MSDERLSRIEDKIDKVTEKIGSIDSTLAAQHESLKYHIKRTDLLESEIKPIKNHVDMMNSSFKLVAKLIILISAIASIVAVIAQVVK